MARTKVLAKADWLGEVVRSFAVNEEINQLLIERLDPAVWRARISGGRTRTIAAIFVHMHHVRRKWIRLSAPHLALPPELDRNCTQAQARKALKASGDSLPKDDRAVADFIGGAEFIFKAEFISKGAEVFAGWLGAQLACGTDDGGLHDCA